MRKFYNQIVNFFKGVFAAEGGLSSKRVVGLGAFIVIAIAAFADIFYKKTISDFIFYGILSIVFACFGLNTFLSAKSMTIKENVATDIVKEEPGADTADDAKDVLNSNKP